VRTRVAIGASLLALIAALAIVLSADHPERTGVNGVPPDAYVASLAPRQTFCQPATLPAGTRAVGLTVGGYGQPGPPLALSLSNAAGTVRGRVAKGYRDGALSVPVATVAHQETGPLCIHNLGDSRVALAGIPAAAPVSTLDGTPSTAAVEVEYLRGTASGFGLGTTVARRVGLLHSGDWLLWALVALMAAAGATAIAVALRATRE
jgi:hypothetical protein